MSTTSGYVFKKLTKQHILGAITGIPNTKILYEEIQKSQNVLGFARNSFGTVVIDYKGLQHNITVNIKESTDEYVGIFNKVGNLNSDKLNIPNYGKPQYVVSFELKSSALSIEIITLILKKLGGVILINDSGKESLFYVKSSIKKDIVYPSLRQVPDEVLKELIIKYLENGDITKINTRLTTKIKAINLFKEFTLRNIHV